MRKTQLDRVAREANQIPGLQVTGTRHYGHNDWSLNILCTTTGYSFVIHQESDWEERKRSFI